MLTKGHRQSVQTFIAAFVLSVKDSRPVSDMMNSAYEGIKNISVDVSLSIETCG